MVFKHNSADPPPYEVRTSGNEREPKARPSLPTSAGASSSSSIWVPWKPFTSRRKTKNDVRARLRQMIIDMELEPAGSGNNPSSTQIKNTTAESVEAILCSCEDACAENAISFHSILQDQYIEGHSPLYWAILKLSFSKSTRKNCTDFDREALCDILYMLFSFLPCDGYQPVSTSSELRLACLSTSNQDAFRIFGLQRTRFPFMSGAEQMLHYNSLKGARSTVYGDESNGNAFSVVIEVFRFHKELVLTRRVGAEFVVRNRIWLLTLCYRKRSYSSSIPMGAWCATLQLTATSAPTRFNGRLEIIKPSSEACENAPPSQAEDSSNVPPSVPMRGSWYGPIATEFTEDSSGIVSLEETPAFSSLQYADSSYISDDGTLSLRLVGQLEKPPG